ncbi:unnamed protein product [marine sediment metagenome]|uniref:Autophagy-related protein n=1 Tax=marine sediment metagenome TaxID=412755 RepID=X1FIF1_9ZZZZ
MEYIIEFQDKYNIDSRYKLSQSVKRSQPGRVPVIIDRRSEKDPTLDKNKYLVPRDISVAKLIDEIRRSTEIDSKHALFFFSQGMLLTPSRLIDQVYEKCKDRDGFLYIIYTRENTFG